MWLSIGYEGDAYTTGCLDMDECSRSKPCGRNALCSNLDGSFRCTCPPGFIGNPLTECTGIHLVNNITFVNILQENSLGKRKIVRETNIAYYLNVKNFDIPLKYSLI